MEAEIKFEKALEQLEKIVEDLEGGNLSLEDAMKKYEEGVKLSRICSQKLGQAENQIEFLTRALNGKVDLEPLGGGSEPKSVDRKKGKKTQKDSSSENDLLLS